MNKFCCPICRKMFFCRKEKRKFCSRKCKETSPNGHNRKLRKKIKCACCKLLFEVRSTGSNKFCSITCFRLQQRLRFDKFALNGKLSKESLKRFLIRTRGEKCEECGWNTQHTITGKVPVQLDHRDGNSGNNSPKNVRLLCPNCHSLTPTFGALNKGKGRTALGRKRSS